MAVTFEVVIAFGALFMIILGALALSFVAMRAGERKHNDEMAKLQEEEEKKKPKASGRRANAGASGGLARMRQTASLRRRRAGGDSDDDDEGGFAAGGSSSSRYEDEGSEGEGEEGQEEQEERRGKKGMRKEMKKARSDQAKASADARMKKMDAASEKRRAKDLEREERERAEEERKRLEEEERVRKEEEEAMKWMDMISVDNEGTGEADVVEEDQGLLQRFVDYITRQKIVPMEDLAAEFGLKAQDAINRVVALEQMGRISGVMDDRGKFIYISPEEMRAVGDYLERRGRVSIAELARKSNELIDLSAKESPAALDEKASEDLFVMMEQEQEEQMAREEEEAKLRAVQEEAERAAQEQVHEIVFEE